VAVGCRGWWWGLAVAVEEEVGDAGGRVSAANAPPLEQKQLQLPEYKRAGGITQRRGLKGSKEDWEHHQRNSFVH